MPEAQFIKALDSQISGTGIPTRLPGDFVAASARRLGWATLIYSGTYSIAYLASRLIVGRAYTVLNDLVALAAILISLALYTAVRRQWLEPRLLLDLGMIYWVVGAVAIDFSLYLGFLNQGVIPQGISWVCVWLVVFPLTVPNSTGKVVLAALVTATAGPLSFMMALLLSGATVPAGASYIQLFLPYYLCAAMGVISSRIVYQLGQDVERARELGSYQLVERLGTGGMGEVWRASHKMLARPAAIKLLRPDEMAATAFGERREMLLRRFEREAQATSLLRSPHTIQLYDFGVTGGGSFYYAMELLEGMTVDELVRSHGPLPPSRAVYLMRQVCDSLCEAHNAGLVHRDIKPGNIYIARLGSSFDFVKVLDFGLVKRQSIFDDKAETHLTTEGSAPGTPEYMPPEIARGAKEVDGRADLYSLGCVGFFMLTGQSVFAGDTPMEIVIAQANSEPELLSTRAAQAIPEELEAIIMACLAKKPEGRPASATELARRLAALRFDESWDNHSAQDWWARHRPAGSPAEPHEVVALP